MTLHIPLPHNWKARKYQQPALAAWFAGIKRELLVWHRRAGKDDIALHKAAVAAHTKIATYWHMLPEYGQARKAIWTAVNPLTGIRRIDEAFPLELRASTQEHEMFIRFRNGSTWQLVGSDTFNSLVGTPPYGIVFSEWALANPAAWAYLAPILLENGGWASFITTPRGRNHVKTMLDEVRTDPEWFTQVLDVDDTGIISAEMVARQLKEYSSIFGEDAAEALIQQEYYCSFEAAVIGSYWGKEMLRADKEGRIGKFEPIPDLPVDTVWDIGVDDSTAIWWFQSTASGPLVLDYYERTGMGIDHFAEVKRSKSFDYKGGKDYVPHDARQRSWTSTNKDGTARQRLEVMRDCKLVPVLVPEHSLADGISAARVIIGKARWNEETCKQGLEALREYQRDWDEVNKIFKPTPKRNWATHGSDAWRYLSLAWRVFDRPERKIVDAPPKHTVFLDTSTGRMTTGLSFTQLRDRNAKKKAGLLERR